MEFHIARSIREQIDLDDLLFSYSGNVIFANVIASRRLAERLDALNRAKSPSVRPIRGSELFAMGLIDELSHALIAKYRKNIDPRVLRDGLAFLARGIGQQQLDLDFFKQALRHIEASRQRNNVRGATASSPASRR